MKVLINHSEITLKGKNRSFFENKLKKNIKHVLPSAEIANLHGRFIVELPQGQFLKNQIFAKLEKLFGIANFSVVNEVKESMEDLEMELLASLKNKTFTTFAVRTKRSDKSSSISSKSINIAIGNLVRKRLNKKVDLTDPDLTIFIEIQRNNFWFYFEKHKGSHGLPVGSSGKVLSLLSGGIDSPVSSYLMAKRGCTVDFLHFHAFSENKYATSSKIKKTIEQLNNYTLYSKAIYVPYTPFQMELLSLDTQYELIIFRRFMLRVAEELAKQNDYQAIITGDNLGQVASQTLENLSATEQAVDLPIFRPLIGFNKNEIIDIARNIGTYDISIQKYKDCCSIIQKHPKTKAKIKNIQREEKELDIDKLVEKTLEESETIVL